MGSKDQQTSVYVEVKDVTSFSSDCINCMYSAIYRPVDPNKGEFIGCACLEDCDGKDNFNRAIIEC